MEIAVVGGGLAGLVAAWQLAARHRVTVFERLARPGFAAHGVGLVHRGAALCVDVPLRVFYPGYYPTLTRLYHELGVASEPVSYATTFSDGSGAPYFRWRNLRWRDASWPFVLPQDLVSARARRIVWGALQFRRAALPALARGELAGRTLAEFVADERIAPDFVHGLLLPAVATIGTCTLADAAAYPADVVAAYHAGGLARQSVRRACHGADDVVARLLARGQRMVTDAGVNAVVRDTGGAGEANDASDSSGVWLHRRGTAPERFDHVVLAVAAPHALALMTDATPPERAALAGFRCRPLQVLMHRDTALMPARRADWSPVHAHLAHGAERPESTIWINAVQPALRDAAPLLQTVQPRREPRAGTLLSSVQFERALVDADTERALGALQALHAEPGRRLWWAGAWAHRGVPLLESAAASALAVARRIEDAGVTRAAALAHGPA